MKQNRAEVSCQVLGLNWGFSPKDDIVTFWAKISWSCSNTLIGFSSQELGTGQAGREEREPITVIGSFYLLPHPPRPAPPPISQIDSEESLKRPEARGQLGRGWGNLGGHGSGNSAESSDHPLSCLRDFVSQCLEKASTSVLWNL